MYNTKKTIKGIANAAKYLGISRCTIHRYIDKKEFPKPVKISIGGTTLREWRKEDLDNFGEHVHGKKIERKLKVREQGPKEYIEKDVPKTIEARFRQIKALHVNSGGVKLNELYKIVIQQDLPELSKERFRECISELGQQTTIKIKPVYTIDEIKDPGRAIESFCIL